MFDDNYQCIHPLLPQNSLANTQLWQAIDCTTQKHVIIKQLLVNGTPTQSQQFYQEYQVYQVLDKLKPPQKDYFFKLLNAKITTTKNWLVLEYHQGKTLKHALATNSLTFFQKIAYLIQLCHALEVLHSQGLVHCDVKPSNVFIHENQLKLFDFGLVKEVNNAPRHQITSGTPAYMSPEQFTGGVITYQSDYYSLGILMYEMLVGQRPFSATTLENWALQHCQLPVPKITNGSTETISQLNLLFNQLLAKLPQNRPRNLESSILLLKNLQKLQNI